MKTTAISITMLTLCFSACTGGEDDTVQLSEHDRTALAALGVADIEGNGDPYILTDDDGARVGEVSIGRTASTSTLLGNTARTTWTADRTTVECNGASLAFDPADATITANARAIVEPCRDALDVTALLVGSAEADQGWRDLTTCILLGTNRYCDGGTEISNNDFLCSNGDSQWVESYPGAQPGSSYCAGLHH